MNSFEIIDKLKSQINGQSRTMRFVPQRILCGLFGISILMVFVSGCAVWRENPKYYSTNEIDMAILRSIQEGHPNSVSRLKVLLENRFKLSDDAAEVPRYLSKFGASCKKYSTDKTKLDEQSEYEKQKYQLLEKLGDSAWFKYKYEMDSSSYYKCMYTKYSEGQWSASILYGLFSKPRQNNYYFYIYENMNGKIMHMLVDHSSKLLD